MKIAKILMAAGLPLAFICIFGLMFSSATKNFDLFEKFFIAGLIFLGIGVLGLFIFIAYAVREFYAYARMLNDMTKKFIEPRSRTKEQKTPRAETAKIVEENKRIHELHCRLTTPGFWPAYN